MLAMFELLIPLVLFIVCGVGMGSITLKHAHKGHIYTHI